MGLSTPIIVPAHRVVNVASVPKRSPFRYPGGKTWLVPTVRAWLRSLVRRPQVFVEPFCGGAIVGLTVCAENLANEVVLGELDQEVTAVWKTILEGDHEWLIDRIRSFQMTRAKVIECLDETPADHRELAFHTLLRNRVQRGGILAPGASLVRNGENGRGVASRWYPETIATRILEIARMRNRIRVVSGDGIERIREYRRRKTAAFFIDPPYTAAGKRAGSRLYRHNTLDHQALFEVSSSVAGACMLTYDESPEVFALAERHGLQVERIPMKNTHHQIMNELVITNIGYCSDLSHERRVSAILKSLPPDDGPSPDERWIKPSSPQPNQRKSAQTGQAKFAFAIG